MAEFFSTLFFIIGFLSTIIGLGALVVWVLESSSAAKRERDDRHHELIRKLGDIEFQLSLKKDNR